MGKDKRGVNRGSCLKETCDCDEFEIECPKNIKCDYCSHAPSQHTNLDRDLEKRAPDTLQISDEPCTKRQCREIDIPGMSDCDEKAGQSNFGIQDLLFEKNLEVTQECGIQDPMDSPVTESEISNEIEVNPEKEEIIEMERGYEEECNETGNDDIDTRQADQIERLIKEKLETDNCNNDQFEIRREGKKWVVKCLRCDINVSLHNSAAGKPRANNFIRHLESSAHLAQSSNIWETIQASYPNVFVLTKCKKKVTCRSCKVEFSIEGAKNPTGNINQHINSKTHKQNNTGNYRNISDFLSKKPLATDSSL